MIAYTVGFQLTVERDALGCRMVMPEGPNNRFARLRPRSSLVRQAQIELLLHHTKFQTIVAPLLGLFLVLALDTDGQMAWVWFVALCLAYAARLIALGYIARREDPELRWRLRAYLIGLCLAGLFWAIAPFAIKPDDVTARLIVAIFVGIVVLVGIVGNFLYYASALVYFVTWIVPGLVSMGFVYVTAFPDHAWMYAGVIVMFLMYTWKCLEVINLPLGDSLELNEDLTRERDRAEESDRAKSDFLAMMSHELRTPLNAIIGYSEVIRDGVFGPGQTEKYRDRASDIRNAAGLLRNLINDLLDLSALQAGGRPLEIGSLEVRDMVDTSVAFLEEEIEKKRIQVDWKLDVVTPVFFGDRQAAIQCVTNVLANAVKYSPEGADIRISVRYTDKDFCLDIEDQGPGIEPEELARIMEPFRRGADAQASAIQGVGLGLSITRELMDRQGGSLELSSNPGTGTCATLVFSVERKPAEIANRQR